MNIGIIIFAYNRSRHLTEVLNGLKNNSEVTKVYVFQDGLKDEADRLEWIKTRAVIDGIDWCEVVFHQASYNKGLARSIVDGINLVFEECDAVVVLEDDCIPTSNFISFMKQCFEKYQNEKKFILSVDIVGRLRWKRKQMISIFVDVFLLGAGERGKIDGMSMIEIMKVSEE